MNWDMGSTGGRGCVLQWDTYPLKYVEKNCVIKRMKCVGLATANGT